MNAVDVTARGLARRAAQAGEVLASPAGAGAIGVARGGTLQDFVDRPLGRIRLESLGFAESNTAAGNAAILRAALDLGPCTCGEGDFPLENFLWKSGDDFWGAGHGTHFVAGAGIVMKFGCLAGNSMTPGDPESGPSYAIEPPARGDAAITLASAADAAQFTAGDVVLVWSSTGYADGYGEFKPAFQQMSGVLAIDGTTLLLEEPVYRDTPAGAAMLAAPGARVTGREQGGDAGISRGVKAGNFSVSSPDDCWQRFGGTYKSEIGPVWVRQSDGLAVQNGLACSTLRVSGTFRKNLAEFPLFAHNSQIHVEGNWSDDPAADNAGSSAVSFAEGAHDNDLFLGSGSSGSAAQRNAAIVFGQGASRNRVHVLGHARFGSARALVNADRPANSPMEYDGNRIAGPGTLEIGACNHVVNLSAATAGERHPLHISGPRLKARAVSNNQVYATGSGLFMDCEIDCPAAAVSIAASAVADVDLSRLRLVNAPTYAIAPGAQVALPREIGQGHAIDYLKAAIDNGNPIAATGFVPRYSRLVKAGTFLDGDTVPFFLGGRCAGTNGSKTLALRVTGGGTAVIASVALPASFADDFLAQGFLQMINVNSERLNIAVAGNGLAAQLVDHQSGSIDADATDLLIEIGGYVANANDQLFIDCTAVTPPIRDVT